MFLVFNQDISPSKQNELVSQRFIETPFGIVLNKLGISQIQPEELIKDKSVIQGEWIKINETDYWMRVSNGMEITLSGIFNRFIVRMPREHFRIDIGSHHSRQIRNIMIDHPLDYLQYVLVILNDYPNEKDRLLLTKRLEFKKYVSFHHSMYKALYYFIYEKRVVPPMPQINEDQFFMEKYRFDIYQYGTILYSLGMKRNKKIKTSKSKTSKSRTRTKTYSKKSKIIY